MSWQDTPEELEIIRLKERVEQLEGALRDVIFSDCCGCSVYGDIAQEALRLSMAERAAIQNAPSYDVPDLYDANYRASGDSSNPWRTSSTLAVLGEGDQPSSRARSASSDSPAGSGRK